MAGSGGSCVSIRVFCHSTCRHFCNRSHTPACRLLAHFHCLPSSQPRPSGPSVGFFTGQLLCGRSTSVFLRFSLKTVSMAIPGPEHLPWGRLQNHFLTEACVALAYAEPLSRSHIHGSFSFTTETGSVCISQEPRWGVLGPFHGLGLFGSGASPPWSQLLDDGLL